MHHPEHALQVQIHRFAREAVTGPHVFLGFDRSRKQSPLQHVRERSRGVISGTPDTLLAVPNLAPFWCELKAGKGTLSDNQREMAARLQSVGHVAAVARSVAEYHRLAADAGVPFIPGAAVMAMRLDGLLGSTEPKPARKPRARKEPAEAKNLRAMARARAAGIYA